MARLVNHTKDRSGGLTATEVISKPFDTNAVVDLIIKLVST